MNKGLDALQEYKRQQQGVNVYADEYLHIIEQELEDKEKFEEIVGMDLDLFMKAVDIKGLLEIEKQYNRLESIYNQLGIKYKKQCEILEIIKKKDVNIVYLKELIKTPSVYGALYNYNVDYDEGDYRQLTQEEYDLLKEVLL